MPKVKNIINKYCIMEQEIENIIKKHIIGDHVNINLMANELLNLFSGKHSEFDMKNYCKCVHPSLQKPISETEYECFDCGKEVRQINNLSLGSDAKVEQKEILISFLTYVTKEINPKNIDAGNLAKAIDNFTSRKLQ